MPARVICFYHPKPEDEAIYACPICDRLFQLRNKLLAVVDAIEPHAPTDALLLVIE